MPHELSGKKRRQYMKIPVCLVVIVNLLAACKGGPQKTAVKTTNNPPAVSSAPVQNEVSGILKIKINEEGVYELSRQDFLMVMPEWKNIAPAHLQLTFRGQVQPIWIKEQGENFKIVFYGYPSDSRYTSDNIYFLTLLNKESSQMAEKAVVPANPPASESYLDTRRFEENKIYAPQAAGNDPFFWYSITMGKKQELSADLGKVADGAGHLRVAVWGSTESSAEYDHHMIVSVNGHALIDKKWDGAGRQTLEADIPAGYLINGANKILLDVPGDTEAAAEINDLDWIEISYPRKAEAEKDVIKFNVSGEVAGPTHLMGFSGDITIYDVTVPTDTIRIPSSSVNGDILFMGEDGHHYMAVGPKGYLKPANLNPAALTPDLRAVGSGADFIAIGPTDLLQPLSPLLEWRKSQGLSAQAIPLDAVYDQFNYGMPEPVGIRAFIEYAVRSWALPPKYVVLVGDATYDPRQYLSTREANRVPTFFIVTSFGGETASDAMMGDVDGDQVPDLAVGRMPAQNADQVRILVEKTLSYEQSTVDNDWRRKVLAIADGQDANFKREAQSFLDRVSSPYQAMLYAPEAGVKDAPQKLTAYFDEGYGLVAYFGHGSINMWGKDRILMAEDVGKLTNQGHLPVVFNMTCLTGLFTHPKVSSLMEAFLWQENGGAVAMLAPTSLTLPEDQKILSNALIDALMQDKNETLGEAFLRAQRAMPVSNPGAREVLLTFLLFGDPALQFGIH